MTYPLNVITFEVDKIVCMKKADLELRIKELELELSNLKSDGASVNSKTALASQESDVRFMTLANYVPAHIAYVNIDTLRYEFVNDLFEKSFGIPKEKIIGSYIKDIIGEENYKFALKYIKEVKLGKSCSYENTFNLSSGKRWIQVKYSPVYNENNKKVVGIAVVSYDITERKQAEEELKKSEEKIRSILNATPFPVAIVDTDDEIIKYWSNSAIELFGHTAPTTEEWYKIAYPDVQYRKEVIKQWKPFLEKAKLTSKPVNTGEYQVSCSDGSQLTCELYATFIEDNLVVTFSDITQSRQFELELIKSKEKAEESDRLKSAFLANMSHEIRTPMNGILGFAELLKKPNLSHEEQKRFIEIIGQSGQRMLNTINSIIDISKIESGLVKVNIQEANINEKLEFTHKFFKPLAEKKGLQLSLKNDLPLNESKVFTDNEKVYGILTNLVRNAIKFTTEGSIEFGCVKKNTFLEFYVKDSGIGIAEQQKEIIFERFRQGSESHSRGYEGTGLGLSISKSFAEMLGGRMWVESKEGLGSTFYFTIPHNLASETDTKIKDSVSPEPKDIQIKDLKILIVEDDEISYSLLTQTLEEISGEVLHAITGVEAVEICRKNSDLDLVLMDIRMPEMNGLEATRRIRQFNNELVIIAQTAYGFESDSKMALEAGCNDYISKPIDMTLLYKMIKKQVNKK